MRAIYDTFAVLWNNSVMRLVVLLAVLSSASVSTVGAAEPKAQGGQVTAAASENVAEAYDQFLIGRHLRDSEDVEGAIAAFKRAMELDPLAADVVAELAALYMQRNRVAEAIATAEQALKIAPTNREAHRVLGVLYAALSEDRRVNAQRSAGGNGPRADERVRNAIQHLEQALDRLVGESDANLRATLARLYIRAGNYDRAIVLLTDLVREESGWQDGPVLLAEAYAGAGRNADAIAWLEQAAPADPHLYAPLADFYERERRWRDASDAYARALGAAPGSAALKTRYASALLNVGGREAVGKARDVLSDMLSARVNDARALYLLSQAERRLGNLQAAQAAARRLIAQNSESPWGFYALAEALEESRQYQDVVDALSPVIAQFRSSSTDPDSTFELRLLLPHLGFAYQEVGQPDKAIAVFGEAHRLSPDDPTVSSHLIQANLAAKKYSAAVDLARAALNQHPDDLRLVRLEAQALRQSGKPDQGIAVLQEALKKHSDEPTVYVALAQIFSETKRGADAVKVLQGAQEKFPASLAIRLELGAVLDKQQRFADAEAAFQQVLARQPDNAAALNSLGYMLAQRGERLDESVAYLKRALEIEPENGAFLDSLGWAYYKADKLDLAVDNLQRAAEQLKASSVVQDHYADALSKLGRHADAIAVWTRALAGDGESIDRGAIDKKIRAAKQKLEKK